MNTLFYCSNFYVPDNHPDFLNNTTNPFNPDRPDNIREVTYRVLRDRFPFEVDYALPDNWRNGDGGYQVDAFFQSGYERGHLTASSDRNLHIKDQYATYSMSNMLPMAPETNQINGAWQGLEAHLSDLARSGKKLHIVAGGYGSLRNRDGNFGTPNGRNTIPEKLWKVAVVLEPNQTIYDIDASNNVIAVILPNDDSLVPDDRLPDGTEWQQDGREDGIGIVSINQIEQLIGGNLDLLRNLPNDSIKSILKNKIYRNPDSSASLLAEFEDSTQSLLSEIEIFDNISSWHDSVFIDSITGNIEPSNGVFETGISKFSPSSISPRDISPFEISSSEVDISHPRVAQVSSFEISPGEIGTIEFSPLQISSRQIDSSQVGFVGQTDINEVSLSPSIPFPQFFDGNSGSIEFLEDSIGIEEIGIVGIPREFLHSSPDRHSSFVFNGVNNGTRYNNSPVLVNNINNIMRLFRWSYLRQGSLHFLFI